jgi:hypothetical protein
MTVQHFIVTGFRYVWQNIRKSVFFIYDKVFYVDFTCSFADILFPRNGELNKQLFVSASRLLDIRRYYEFQDLSFPYQTNICSHIYGYSEEMQEKYRDKFQKLIQSVETEGFRADSKLLVDKDLFLEDGAHRIGLLFYKGTLEATVKCVWRECFYQWKFDGYCHSEFPPQMFEDILQECTRMQQTFLERGYSFVLWISGGEESEIRHLLFGLTPFIDVYKTYAVASNATQYDGGYLVQFTPKNLEYAVTRKGYYAKNVKRMESILSKRIANLGWNQRFAISQNCLEGRKMMETVQAFLKEVE